MRVEPKPTPQEAVYRRAMFWKGEYDTAVAEVEALRAELEQARRERDEARAMVEQAHYDGYSTGWAENDGHEEPPEEWMEDSWVNSHTRGRLQRLAAPSAPAPGEGGGA